ncbi:MAG TPA: TIGR03936 family radical SAM-associated protein [Nocardioidaceae bacterium]|nr:TIGR03936 family radical SAM-associated protein [Nocardioidaceae bacterium]
MADQPEQQAPPVQRLRLRYAKRGRLRFASHRDFARAFERALVRARVPMAYSSGFHPHPRISYAGAAPTGAASEAEYLELALARTIDPVAVHAALDTALPDGLDVLEVVVTAGGSLADRLQASHWRTRLPGVRPEAATAAVAAFLAERHVDVERTTKKGPRTFDARAAVMALTVVVPGDREECAILEMVLRHGTPSVRPDDVLAGLRGIAGLDAGAAAVHGRLAQGPWEPRTGTVGDPLAPDRDTP